MDGFEALVRKIVNLCRFKLRNYYSKHKENHVNAHKSNFMSKYFCTFLLKLSRIISETLD